MKFKFKYVSMLVIAALMAGVTSCSDKEESVGSQGTDDSGLLDPREDDLTIQIDIQQSKETRAESATNVGIAPHVFDMTLIFVGQVEAGSPEKVLKVVEGNISQLTGTGQKFKELPIGVNGLYIIGNTKDDYSAAGIDPTIMSTVTTYNSATTSNFGKLAYKDASKATLLDYNPKKVSVDPAPVKYDYVDVENFMKNVRISLDNYNLTDAKAVNISGYAPITATQGTTPVRVVVTPAISRYEIAEIRSTGTGFEIKGIYINNTMKEISVDGQQYPNPVMEPEVVMNYGWNSAEWNYSLWNWNYDSDSPVVRDGINPWTTAYYAYANPHVDRNTRPTDNLYGYSAGWNKWYETELSNMEDISGGNKTAYTPKGNTAVTKSKFWSYYIASARKQDPASSIIVGNPYIDDGFYNRIGFECGIWPYQTELEYIKDGEGTRTNYPSQNANYNKGTFVQEMAVDDPLVVNSGKGIQYGVFPTICVEVKLDAPNKFGMDQGWLTITKFYNADDGSQLQYPIPGTVYQIKAIAFDPDTNLTPDPQWPKDETEISVQVKVQGWIGQNTSVVPD